MNNKKQLKNYQKKTQKTSILNQPISSGSLSETNNDITLTTKQKKDFYVNSGKGEEASY